MDDKPQETREPDAPPGHGGPRRRVNRRMLLGSVAGCAVIGGVLVLLPWGHGADGPVEPAPGAPALAAVASGVPTSLPGLESLIAERQRHLEKHPQDAEAWAVLGAARVEQGRRLADPAHYPRAEQALRTSLKVRAKDNAGALRGMAVLANARRDYPAAREWGERALRLEPKRWTTYPPLIEAYAGLGDGGAAEKTLDRLKALWSGPVVMARAAALYRDKGLQEDAAAQLSDAAAAAGDPAERAGYLERAGQLAWERGDREDALRHFQEALRTDPDQRAAQAGQGRALAALGRTTEAIDAYRAALARQPRPEYALELGELYTSLGLRQAARVQYDLLRERVRAAAAHGVDEDLVLGRFEADHGDPGAAVRLLRAEWRRQPSAEVADALGWALHRSGKPEEALEYAVRATERTKGGVRNALPLFHRGMIEGQLGRWGPARRHLREAMALNPYFSPLRVPQAEAALERLGEPPVDDGPPAWAEEAERAEEAKRAKEALEAEKAEKAKRLEEAEKAKEAKEAKRAGEAERAEVAKRAEKTEETERAKKAEEAKRAKRAKEAERTERAERDERAEGAERTEGAEEAERTERTREAEKAVGAERAGESEETVGAEEAEAGRSRPRQDEAD